MPEPVNVEYLAKSWASLMRLGNASAYATFRNGEANGVLLGLFTPDLYTGNLQGVEFLWAGRDTKSMLKEFESDCKEKGCKKVVCGISCDVMGDRVPVLRRFYRQNGYAPEKEAFSKRL